MAGLCRYLERNSFRVEAHALQRPMRLGCVAAGTAFADDSMAVVDDHEVEQRTDA